MNHVVAIPRPKSGFPARGVRGRTHLGGSVCQWVSWKGEWVDHVPIVPEYAVALCIWNRF